MKCFSLFIVLFMSATLFGQEICQNGIDDDADGFIDMYDTDCACYNADSYPTSLIPNPSFEDMENCPNQTGQLEFATGWKQATAGTPDYFNCGYSWSSADAVGLKAADGSGYVGALYTPGYKEYIGTCPDSPLSAGTAYQMVLDMAMFSIDADGNACGIPADHYAPVEVTVYGNKHCSSFQTTNLGCPTGDDTQTSTQGDPSWVVLGSATYTPGSDWKKVIIHFTPAIDVGAIMIGPPCTLPPGYGGFSCNAYAVYDHVILNTYASYFGTVEAPVLEASKTEDCDGAHYTLEAEPIEGASHYWVSPQNITVQDIRLEFDAPGETGTYSSYYVLGSCTSAVATVNPYPDAKTQPASEPVLPNIITPNGDGINDVLDAETIVPDCLPYELSLLDRWGGLIYRQTNGQPAFAGHNGLGVKVSAGVYFYTIRQNGMQRKGSLTVVW